MDFSGRTSRSSKMSLLGMYHLQMRSVRNSQATGN
jgi:hypothetical protein